MAKPLKDPYAPAKPNPNQKPSSPYLPGKSPHKLAKKKREPVNEVNV